MIRAEYTKNRPIIVHSHLRWDFLWQRPQPIFSRLTANHRILFIEEPIIEPRNPQLRISEPHANVVRAIPVFHPRQAFLPRPATRAGPPNRDSAGSRFFDVSVRH
jgi:hypothetical protein